jgi:hypothetical protein
MRDRLELLEGEGASRSTEALALRPGAFQTGLKRSTTRRELQWRGSRLVRHRKNAPRAWAEAQTLAGAPLSWRPARMNRKKLKSMSRR